ncbi:hypothetical protein AZE42_07692 [Rhizopogon vesiculosus]|uniref:Uncharacterized protein n=1 Tax=Rhizopogon vesiculosus TaxID=180088 RepID=A0A1J8PQK1_9AGAM|nr:hypothetical protein AZE42_07692 [Rhizopogon vesiculosus]
MVLAHMFLPQIIGYGVLTLAVLKLIQRRASIALLEVKLTGVNLMKFTAN